MLIPTEVYEAICTLLLGNIHLPDVSTCCPLHIKLCFHFVFGYELTVTVPLLYDNLSVMVKPSQHILTGNSVASFVQSTFSVSEFEVFSKTYKLF